MATFSKTRWTRRNNTPPPGEIAKAQDALTAGRLIVYPTDTLYGLGCRASHPPAIKRLRSLKDLPADRGVSVVFATLAEAKGWTRWTPTAQRLADAFLPGPLTLILDAAPSVPNRLLAEEGTIGIRHVDRPATVALARAGPVVSTSANKHGAPNAETIEEAREVFDTRIEAYVDAGPLTGPASTVVEARHEPPTVIREGPLSEAEILEADKDG